MFKFDRNNAWWAFDFVANWMEQSFRNMSKAYVHPMVQNLQASVEAEATAAVRDAESMAEARGTTPLTELSASQTRIQRRVATTWWGLAEMLVVRYNDGYLNYPENDPESVVHIGYPAFWLEMIGFDQESYHVKWLQPSSAIPTHLPQEEKLAFQGALARESASQARGSDASMATRYQAQDSRFSVFSIVEVLAIASTSAVIAALAGFGIGRRSSVSLVPGTYYARIEA
jgi:hypothetical protein